MVIRHTSSLLGRFCECVFAVECVFGAVWISCGGACVCAACCVYGIMTMRIIIIIWTLLSTVPVYMQFVFFVGWLAHVVVFIESNNVHPDAALAFSPVCVCVFARYEIPSFFFVAFY